MKVQDLLETETRPDGSELVAKVGKSWLWKVPQSTYDAIYKKHKDSVYYPVHAVPANAQDIWFVSNTFKKQYYPQPHQLPEPLYPDQAISEYESEYMFLTSVPDKLFYLTGQYKLPPTMLKQIAKLTGAQNAPNLPPVRAQGNVLHQGEVKPVKQVVATYAKPTLKDGTAVYAFPKQALWTVGDLLPARELNDPSWDTQWQLDTPAAGVIILRSHDDVITHVGDIAPNKIQKAVRLIHELAARENLTLDAKLNLPEPPKVKKKKIQPEGNMHRMLAYVAEHPGATRSDWFVKHLGGWNSDLPSWTASNAVDGVAANLGWIKNEGTSNKYSLHITPVGKLVLARLNAGHAVQITSQA